MRLTILLCLAFLMLLCTPFNAVAQDAKAKPKAAKPAKASAKELPSNIVETAEKAATHIEALSGIVGKHVSDCDAMGTALEAYSTENAKSLRGYLEKLENLSAEEQKALEDTYKPRLEKALSGMVEGLVACAHEPKVSAAISAIDGSRAPATAAKAKTQTLEALKPEAKKKGEKMIGLLEDMSKIIDSNKDQCAKMGTELVKFTDKHGKIMRALNKDLEAMSEGQRNALEISMKPRFEKITQAFVSLIECASDDNVQKAMESMQ